MLTDGKGIPFSVAVDGANRHDKMLVKGTLDATIIQRPSHKVIQNICMDKGYDFPDIRELVRLWLYCPYPETWRKKHKKKEIPDYRARRRVVEKTHSWLKRFRRMLIRSEKKIEITLLCFILLVHG
jgi:putative transposase